MKPKIMEKWTTALESGEFKQAKGSLKSNKGGFCCLGVLCEIYHQETGKGKWVHDDEGGIAFKVGRVAERDYLPTAVQKWAGIKHGSADLDLTEEERDRLVKLKKANPKCKYTFAPVRSDLAELNDNKMKFKAIAKVIKNHVEDL